VKSSGLPGANRAPRTVAPQEDLPLSRGSDGTEVSMPITLDLSTGNLSSGQWVCHICARGFVTGRRPWSVYACEDCWRLDQRIGRELGGERFLPLGIHSLLNGVGVPYTGGPLVRDASIDQVLAMLATHSELHAWRDQEVHRLADQCHIRGDEVDAEWWQELHPRSPVACGFAYQRLIEQNHPWLVALVPQLADASWLIDASQPTAADIKARQEREATAEAENERWRQARADDYRRYYEAQVRRSNR